MQGNSERRIRNVPCVTMDQERAEGRDLRMDCLAFRAAPWLAVGWAALVGIDHHEPQLAAEQGDFRLGCRIDRRLPHVLLGDLDEHARSPRAMIRFWAEKSQVTRPASWCPAVTSNVNNVSASPNTADHASPARIVTCSPADAAATASNTNANQPADAAQATRQSLRFAATHFTAHSPVVEKSDGQLRHAGVIFAQHTRFVKRHKFPHTAADFEYRTYSTP